MIHYKKYEFCKAMGCVKLDQDKCIAQSPKYCVFTAKEFHEWLRQNFFVIVSPEDEYEASNLSKVKFNGNQGNSLKKKRLGRR